MGRSPRVWRALAAVLMLWLLACGIAAPPALSRDLVPLRLAVLPCTNIQESFRKFQPLFAYLRATAGVGVTLVVPGELAEFEAAVRNGAVDFALQDPHTFQRVAALFDPSSLLQTRALDGAMQQSAVVVVRRGSGLTRLTQLRGKTVMFGPRTSSPKWVAARLLFESNGISVDRDLRVLNGGCCEDIAFSVIVGTADAGLTCDHFLGLHDARQKSLGVDPSAVSVIARTATVPTRVLAARKGVPAAVVDAVARALLHLNRSEPAHESILTSAEIGGFTRTTEAEYLKPLAAGATRARP
jgi:phosphonate transport system substrate-binding protein